MDIYGIKSVGVGVCPKDVNKTNMATADDMKGVVWREFMTSSAFDTAGKLSAC